MKMWKLAISILLDGISGQENPQTVTAEELRGFLDKYSSEYTGMYREHIKDDWNQLTNRTKENFERFQQSRKKVAFWKSHIQLTALQLGYQDVYTEFLSPLDQKRMDEALRIGTDTLVLENESSQDYSQKYLNLTMLQHKLKRNLDTTTVTVGSDELRFSDVQNILNTMYKMPSTFESPCMAYFTQMDFWHGILAKIGRKSRQDFITLRDLYNDAAAKNGFAGATEEILHDYGSGTDIKSLVSSIWIDIFPLYKKLHSVVRFELGALFTEDLVNLQGAIPAHLLGSIHGDTWEHLFELLSPDDQYELVDDEELFMNVDEMVQYVDNLFKDLGFPPMPQDFMKESKFQKLDKTDSCEAGAWDFKGGNHFRIHMCAINKRKDLRQMIFLFAQAHFYRAFSGLDILLQKAANPALFHTIPEVILMYASLHDKHAQLFNMTTTTEINFLMYMALKELPFLAFAKSLEEWRWKVFSGMYPESQFQTMWEDIVFENMGLMQPVERDVSDIDPLTKIHILLNLDYSKYFLSTPSLYEILASLCPPETNGKCDLRKDTKRPGTILLSAMSKGNTMPWENVYQTLTGSTTISGQALRNYFKPLEDHLDKKIELHRLKVGWKRTKPARKKDILPCSAASTSFNLQVFALLLLTFML